MVDGSSIKKKWRLETKEKAKALRIGGATYGEIQREIGKVAKSTLCDWLKGIPQPEHESFTDPKSWMAKIRKISTKKIKEKRAGEIEVISKEVKEEMKSWSFLKSIEAQKAFLGLLYWAEGQRRPLSAPVKFANTDPKLVLLFLAMLRNCYELDESKLRVQLYVHWYHDIPKTKKFWSELLNIDESRFSKVFIKKRSKTKRFRKNFAGICFLLYHSTDLRWKIVDTGYNIAEIVTSARSSRDRAIDCGSIG